MSLHIDMVEGSMYLGHLKTYDNTMQGLKIEVFSCIVRHTTIWSIFHSQDMILSR